MEIDRFLIEYPEMRKYVYGGEKVEENTPDLDLLMSLDRLMSIVEFVVDAVENIEVYKKYITKKEEKVG